MILIKSKLSKVLVIIFGLILAGIVGFFLPHKSLIIETPTLYKIVGVIDGDTIQVSLNNKEETVRLLGIDTPEVPNPYKPIGCFSEEASNRTKELLKNKSVYLIPDPMSSDRDKYGRLLRYVFLENGYFLNAELIKEGYAYNYIYEPFQFMKEFNRLETIAKEAKLGLWGVCE
ncbi:MAG: thermonuclease family protein [Nanoarchaeota archaeon]